MIKMTSTFLRVLPHVILLRNSLLLCSQNYYYNYIPIPSTKQMTLHCLSLLLKCFSPFKMKVKTDYQLTVILQTEMMLIHSPQIFYYFSTQQKT